MALDDMLMQCLAAAGLWSIMPWDLDKACGNTKGWDDWPYNFPFGALNNHGLKACRMSTPCVQSKR
jgi:hypothetical protein